MLNVTRTLYYNYTMGRQRRTITDDGMIMCSACGRLRHISQYRTLEVIEGVTPLEDIWYEEKGKLYGRPAGYDKKCASMKAMGRERFNTYMMTLSTEEYADSLIARDYEEARQMNVYFDLIRDYPPLPPVEAD